MVGFRERFQCEFAGTVKRVRWDDQAASATAYPQFFGTARSSIDLLGVAAGNRGVSCGANQEHRNGTRGQGFSGETSSGSTPPVFASASMAKTEAGRKGFAKKWTEAQPCIFVAYFAQVGKWVFRHDAFNAWFDDC